MKAEQLKGTDEIFFFYRQWACFAGSSVLEVILMLVTILLWTMNVRELANNIWKR